MKYFVLLLILTLSSESMSAKKVRFSVDMADQTISPLGIHVMGDFQDEAGFVNGDWQPNTTLMTPNSDSTIFSVVVDIPAFRKYEYRFINGDQSYETEFIPIPSRVGYDFIDNRWIYIDSLANDTTQIGAIVFGGNAPRGLNLMRFLVQIPTSVSVDVEGVHVIGDFQNWELNQTYMYSFVPNVHEVIAYATLGNHQYRFVNGEIEMGMELGLDSCFTDHVRLLELVSDSVLTVVCFDACTQDCDNSVDIQNYGGLIENIYPNPSWGVFHLNLMNLDEGNIIIWDCRGKMVKLERFNGKSLDMDFSDLPVGEYVVGIQDASGNFKQMKKWDVLR